MKTLQLGMKVRDKVSGVEGIAIARTEFLNGCIRISIQPRATKKDGSIPGELWFDDKQIEIIGKGVVVESKPTGGPATMNPPKGARA